MVNKKAYFEKLLLRTERLGIDSLISYLRTKTDFYTTPASTRFHGSCEGGLLHHSLDVYGHMQTLIYAYADNDIIRDDIKSDSVILCSLLHDICRGCTGKECFQSTNGMIPVVDSYGGKFYSTLQMCRHEKNKRAQAEIDRLLKSSRVPAAYARDSFSDYEITDYNSTAVKAARWIIGSGDKGLFLYGPRGTGKTKLAAIIANEKARSGEPVLFSSVPDLMSDIRATFGSDTTAETLRAVREAPCLLLDDLGAERMTEWVGEQLFCILNYRYNEKLQTVVTSNYDSVEIIKHMATVDRSGKVIDDIQGQRIMSRICGMCEPVQILGRDYRTRGVAV